MTRAGCLALSMVLLSWPLRLAAQSSARASRAPRLSPFLSGGPALAYQTGCWIDGSDGPRTTCRAYDRSPSSGGIPERRRLDVSALVGGGITVPTAGHRVRVSALYDRGLRRVSPQLPTQNRAWYYLASVEW